MRSTLTIGLNFATTSVLVDRDLSRGRFAFQALAGADLDVKKRDSVGFTDVVRKKLQHLFRTHACVSRDDRCPNRGSSMDAVSPWKTGVRKNFGNSSSQG
jgi:hypothetical protein